MGREKSMARALDLAQRFFFSQRHKGNSEGRVRTQIILQGGMLRKFITTDLYS